MSDTQPLLRATAVQDLSDTGPSAGLALTI